ncbi:MAG: hypothetical protein M1337_07675 [Actinobacteria bacterium]|nr:hypothetical protein [Actinomycetota bacterium]
MNRDDLLNAVLSSQPEGNSRADRREQRKRNAGWLAAAEICKLSDAERQDAARGLKWMWWKTAAWTLLAGICWAHVLLFAFGLFANGISSTGCLWLVIWQSPWLIGGAVFTLLALRARHFLYHHGLAVRYARVLQDH